MAENEEKAKVLIDGTKRNSGNYALPSTYDGKESFQLWIKAFDLCCKVNGWTDKTKLLRFPTLLRGEAFTYYITLSDTVNTDWSALIAAFTGFFDQDSVPEIQMVEFKEMSMRVDETLKQYAVRLQLKANKIFTNPEESGAKQLLLRSKFLSTIPFDLRREAYAQKEESFNTIVSRVQELSNLYVGGRLTALASVQVLAPQTDSIRSANALSLPDTTQPKREELQSNFGMAPPKVQCYKCQGYGHYRYQCPTLYPVQNNFTPRGNFGNRPQFSNPREGRQYGQRDYSYSQRPYRPNWQGQRPNWQSQRPQGQQHSQFNSSARATPVAETNSLAVQDAMQQILAALKDVTCKHAAKNANPKPDLNERDPWE